MRVAQVAPDSKIAGQRAVRRRRRPHQPEAVGSAIAVLEEYRRQYPSRPSCRPDVTRKLAVAYAEANRPGEAAAEFERIAASATEGPAVQREALIAVPPTSTPKPATRPKTAAMLGSSSPQYPTPLAGCGSRHAEHLAEYAGQGRRLSRAAPLVPRDRPRRRPGRHGAHRPYPLPRGQAQLDLAAAARDAFRAIRLALPLKKSLVVKRKSHGGGDGWL